ISESWDSLKGSFGRHNEMMSENIAVPLGGRNKLTENPDAVAGAVVGGILAAPLIGGAMGGSGGSSLGGFGTEGAFSKAFQPQVTEVSAWNKLKGGFNNMMDFGNKDLGTLYKDIDFDDPANDDLLGLISDVEGEIAGSKGAEKGLDLQEIGKMLQSIQAEPDYKISHSGGAGGRGFRFDQEPYKNKLAQREFDEMYGARITPKYR
ncbi:MAG: hypothetical protein ACRC6V_14340, partial [Bacteroidales bacterium]